MDVKNQGSMRAEHHGVRHGLAGTGQEGGLKAKDPDQRFPTFFGPAPPKHL